MEALPHQAVVKDVLGSWLELQEGMTLGILMISRGMPICVLSFWCYLCLLMMISMVLFDVMVVHTSLLSLSPPPPFLLHSLLFFVSMSAVSYTHLRAHET